MDEVIMPEVRAKRIGREEVHDALEIMQKYHEGKTNLENRVVNDELWYKLQHWQIMRKKQEQAHPELRGPEPVSGWLFNAIMNKHADAMDNAPEPVVLPREFSDEQAAKTLSDILPVIMENVGYEQVYSDAWWDKLKHGTSIYGVFWDKDKENGLGDIDVHEIDLLKVFWEPGIMDIQKSRNLFITELVDTDLLDEQYPEYKGQMGGEAIDVRQYVYDDDIDTTDKSLVIDWYYKVNQGGRTVLHYCKFVNECVLYATENDPALQERGLYDHGLYPVVFDTLFPEQGTPAGFGYVTICKDPQIYIDKISAHIMESSLMGTKKRFLVSDATNINEADLLDWEKPIVRVEGELTDTRVKEITVQPLAPIYLQVQQARIEEMKDTAGNRDVNSGQTGSGVTAAAAIAALQEAGNKTSRDMIAASYRAQTKIYDLVIELVRQFYTEERTFRITGPNGTDYVSFSGAMIADQATGVGPQGEILVRRPVFDLKIKAQKTNPFSRMELNELAKELYSMGFFDPNRAQEAMLALDMMQFEGIEKVKEQVQQGQMLMNMLQQMQTQMDQMAGIIQSTTGYNMGIPTPAGAGPQPISEEPKPKTPVTDAVMASKTPMTSYGNRLAERAKPNLNAPTATMPR